MLINVGVNWSEDAMIPDLMKKIENYDEADPYLNDLYKLDFIHLNQVLFDKKEIFLWMIWTKSCRKLNLMKKTKI